MADDDEGRVAEAMVQGVTQIATAILAHAPLAGEELRSLLRAITEELAAAATVRAPNSEAVRAAVAAVSANPSLLAIAPGETPVPENDSPSETHHGSEETLTEPTAETTAEANEEDPSDGEDAAAEEVPGEPEPPESDRWAHLSRVPVLPIKDSITYDAIICLFDGVKKKMLKRYIRAKYGMEETDYKAWFDLPEDYPMVAPGYAAQKAVVAIAQGLGTSNISKAPREPHPDGNEGIPRSPGEGESAANG